MSNDLTISGFCRLHRACWEGRRWAMDNCLSMKDAWKKLPPNYLLWVADCQDVLTLNEQLSYFVFCCQGIFPLLTDQRSREVVIMAEKVLDGQATNEEFNSASEAAWDAWIDIHRSKRSLEPITAESTISDRVRMITISAQDDAAFFAAGYGIAAHIHNVFADNHNALAIAKSVACTVAKALEEKGLDLPSDSLDSVLNSLHELIFDSVLAKQAAWLRANCKPNFAPPVGYTVPEGEKE